VCRRVAEPFSPPVRNRGMNPSNESPLDRTSAAELVARVILDIDAGDDELRDVLLSELLFTAWGDVLAQRQ
jgi:hypothetical protein